MVACWPGLPRALALACLAVVASGWNAVVGITFDASGDLYGWEKGGRAWIVHPDGSKHPTPLIDISEEVGNWVDRWPSPRRGSG